MNDDRMKLFRRTVREKGQAQVARDLGYSVTTINQVFHDTYMGRLDKVLERCAEMYGGETVVCPVLGEITLRRCARERRTPFSAASPLRIQVHRACQECGRRS